MHLGVGVTQIEGGRESGQLVGTPCLARCVFQAGREEGGCRCPMCKWDNGQVGGDRGPPPHHHQSRITNVQSAKCGKCGKCAKCANETMSRLDKAPRLSISIVIWILSSDTDWYWYWYSLFVSSTNSIQIVRRQCCLVQVGWDTTTSSLITNVQMRQLLLSRFKPDGTVTLLRQRQVILEH